MEDNIKILFTGDFYGGHRTENLIQSENFSEIFNDFLPIIRSNDIAITNLESPLTISTKSIPKTGPAIKASPKTAEALNFAGFNLLTLANNHIMDFGEIGLRETMEVLEKSKIDFLGAGENLKQASSIFYKEIKGKKLAFINFAENEWATTQGNAPGANPLNPVANYYAIRQAKTQADFVFVVAHGGHEMYSLPSPRMKEAYRFFIDAGANAVIGHHTHVISGYEIYKGCPVFYSLGNFVFDSLKNKDPRWHKGIAVQFSISGEKLAFEVIPYSQNAEKPGVHLLSGAEKAAVETEIRRLSETILDDTKLEDEFEKHCQKVARLYDYYLEPHSNKYLSFVQRNSFLPSFLSKKKRLLFKNLIRCEAHRDVVLKIIHK